MTRRRSPRELEHALDALDEAGAGAGAIPVETIVVRDMSGGVVERAEVETSSRRGEGR